jgi:malonyl CoA-acyl carrier protein transacylase
MNSVWVFPGQGSQYRGMGAALFERFPQLVEQADSVLGYSIRRLVLEDPDDVLSHTELTQPALYFTTALSMFEKRAANALAPRYYAGHSLGEFNALLAAGAYDFQTGLRLVRKRGELMARAPKGAMAAVIGLEQQRVRDILAGSSYSTIDIANINSPTQLVLSGPYEAIHSCAGLFTQAGAKYLPLNVSAAFHSRMMQGVQEEFARFLATISLQPLTADVIANYTARPYPRTDYADLLVKQITHPVRWSESITWLLSQGSLSLEEIGPGTVLTKLFVKIRDSAPPAPAKPVKPRTVFMYSGQGSQYYLMGQELYEHDAVFRRSMQLCDEVHRSLTGRSLVAELYDDARRFDELVDVSLSHPALFSVGYSLTQVLIDRKIEPDGVLGYSLGEYIAAAVAGALSLEDALAIIVQQARLLKEHAANGGMLTVLASVDHFERNPSLYAGSTLASVNYAQNFVVSGSHATLVDLKTRLDEIDIVSLLLPVQHGFHSPLIEPIEAEFRKFVERVPVREPRLPMYSAARRGALSQLDGQYFWDVARQRVDFLALMTQLIKQGGDVRFVDLGPAGTLSTFIKYGFGGRVAHAASINQFGRNLQTVSQLVAGLSA